MKRWICLLSALLFFCSVSAAFADYTGFSSIKIKPSRSDTKEKRDMLRVAVDESGTTVRFRIQPDGSLVMHDASGATQWYKRGTPIVYIDSVNDLTQYSSATSGQSFFQCEPGTTYIVDFVAINASGTKPSSGVSTISWSGVSAILPNAANCENMDVTIIIGATGNYTATQYGSMLSGATALWIWPYPGSACTSYSKTQAGTYTGTNLGVQTLVRVPQNKVAGADTTVEMASGASIFNVETLGESVTIRLDPGAVSAYPVQMTVW